MNLTQRGFCNSFSGVSFSLPAQYNKKYFEQTKRQAVSPHFARFSTDIANPYKIEVKYFGKNTI